MGCGSSNYAEGSDGKRNSFFKQQMEQQQIETAQVVDLSNVAAFLGKVPLFQSLTNQDRQRVADSCTPEGYKQGEAIIKQGDLSKEFYFILSGEVTVRFKPPSGPEDMIAALKAGDYFGEAALLKDIPRAATIVAENVVQTLKMTREKFMELGLTDKLVFPARKAVGAAKNVKAKPPSPKTKEERRLIENALLSNQNLNSLLKLTGPRLQKIVDLMWKESIPANTSLIKQGDLDAHYFYVVQDGQFVVSVSETGKAPKIVSTQTSGGSFGEVALLYLSARVATVKAKTDSIVWAIDRTNFQKLMKEENPEKQAEYVACLATVKMFDSLLSEEKKAIANAVVEKDFQKDQVIIEQGDPGACLYILYEGEVSVAISGQQMATKKANGYSMSEVIGERALITNEPRAATVTVLSEKARCLALDRDSFNYLLGPLEDIMRRPAAEKKARASKKTFGRIRRKDLKSLGLLGCGGFGAVELVQHQKSEGLYALKSVSKGYIVECGMEENIMAEKDILVLASGSPFVIELFETYNGSQSLYFLLEVCMGGELYAVYANKNFTGSELHAKYYTAGAISALKYLHKLRVVYRDLKPENMILTVAGAPKLIDMGLAKVICGKTYTTCGTPAYFAPEVITQQGHSFAVDWWCVGILVFELMSGGCPFDAPEVMDMYKMIQKGFAGVKDWPEACKGSCQVFIKEMCTLEPKKRLPLRLGGSDNIFSHEWYEKFDWDGFTKFSMVPPYNTPSGKGDIKNFRANKADKPTQLKYVEDPSNLWDENFATFSKDKLDKNSSWPSKTE